MGSLVSKVFNTISNRQFVPCHNSEPKDKRPRDAPPLSLQTAAEAQSLNLIAVTTAGGALHATAMLQRRRRSKKGLPSYPSEIPATGPFLDDMFLRRHLEWLLAASYRSTAAKVFGCITFGTDVRDAYGCHFHGYPPHGSLQAAHGTHLIWSLSPPERRAVRQDDADAAEAFPNKRRRLETDGTGVPRSDVFSSDLTLLGVLRLCRVASQCNKSVLLLCNREAQGAECDDAIHSKGSSMFGMVLSYTSTI